MEVLRPIYRQLAYNLTGYRLSRFRPIGALKRLVDDFLMSDLAEGVYLVNGFRMRLRDKDVGLALTGFNERYVMEYFSGFLRPGMTVIDVGAHIGCFSLAFARLVGPAGRVIAFEPEPSNYELLKENLALNGVANTTPVFKALSDKCGALSLYLSPDNLGGHTCYPTRLHSRGIDVETITLDEYMRQNGIARIDAVKMDIEGFEYFALRGMKNALRNNPALKLVMEFTPELMDQAGVQPLMLLELLDECGFGQVSEIKRSVVPTDRNSLLQQREGTMLACSHRDSR